MVTAARIMGPPRSETTAGPHRYRASPNEQLTNQLLLVKRHEGRDAESANSTDPNERGTSTGGATGRSNGHGERGRPLLG